MRLCIVKAVRRDDGLSERTPDPHLSGREADHTIESFVAAQGRANTVCVHFSDLRAKKGELVQRFLEQCKDSDKVRYFTTAIDGAPRREVLFDEVVTVEPWEELVQELGIGGRLEREALSDV